MPTLDTKTKLGHLTPLQWLICAVACIGFAFDTYELLMLTLIVRPALLELLPRKPAPLFSTTGLESSFTFRQLPEAFSGCSADI